VVDEIARENNRKVEELLETGDTFLESGDLFQASECYRKANEIAKYAGSHRLVLKVAEKINQVVDATLKNPPGCSI